MFQAALAIYLRGAKVAGILRYCRLFALQPAVFLRHAELARLHPLRFSGMVCRQLVCCHPANSRPTFDVARFPSPCPQAICSVLLAPIVYFLVGFSTSNNGYRFFVFMVVGTCGMCERRPRLSRVPLMLRSEQVVMNIPDASSSFGRGGRINLGSR